MEEDFGEVELSCAWLGEVGVSLFVGEGFVKGESLVGSLGGYRGKYGYDLLIASMLVFVSVTYHDRGQIGSKIGENGHYLVRGIVEDVELEREGSIAKYLCQGTAEIDGLLTRGREELVGGNS